MAIQETQHKDWQNYPDEEYKYFIYERDNGMMFFNSMEIREQWFQSIKEGYLDDGWDEEVENIVAGEITHTTQQINRVDKPDNLDEDGLDEEGEYWNNDYDYICGYALKPLIKAGER